MSLDHFSELISWRQGLSTARGGLRCALGRGFPARKKLHTHTGRVVYSGVASHWPQYGDGVAAQRAEQQREILGRSRRRRGGDLGHGEGAGGGRWFGQQSGTTHPATAQGLPHCRFRLFWGTFSTLEHTTTIMGRTTFNSHSNELMNEVLHVFFIS